MKLTQKQRVFKHAVQLLNSAGWVQGWSGNSRQGYCATGAIRAAAKELGEHTLTLSSNEFYTLMDYNDSPGRTKSQVIKFLKRKAGLK